MNSWHLGVGVGVGPDCWQLSSSQNSRTSHCQPGKRRASASCLSVIPCWALHISYWKRTIIYFLWMQHHFWISWIFLIIIEVVLFVVVVVLTLLFYVGNFFILFLFFIFYFVKSTGYPTQSPVRGRYPTLVLSGTKWYYLLRSLLRCFLIQTCFGR